MDAHCSGSNTAEGEIRLPVLEEIAAIKNAGIKNSIILVDDIRGFRCPSANYLPQWRPSILDICNAILEINEQYRFAIIGDTAIGFPPQDNVALSPVVNACTISRLYGFEETQITTEMVLEAEKTIGNATGHEKEALEEIPFAESGYYNLWRGLMLLNKQQFEQAMNEFNLAIDHGFDHWRSLWYLAQATFGMNNINDTLTLTQQVIEQKPGFQPALDLLHSLETR